MGRIPQYQRSRLASELVGTPGVDPSAGQVASDVAKVSSNVAGQFFDQAIERQRAIDSVEQANLYSEAVVASQQKFDEYQKANQAYPTGKTDILKEQLDSVYKGIAERASNDRVKSSFLTQASSIRSNTLIKENSWARQQENLNTESRIISSNNALATQANVLGMSGGSLKDILQAHSELISTAQQNINTARAAGFDMSKYGIKSLQSINGGLISGLIQDRPELAVSLLNDPNAFYQKTENGIVDLLGVEERKQYKDAARKRFEGALATADYQAKVNAALAHGDVYSKIVRNEATLADINVLESDSSTEQEKKNTNALRNIYLERKPFDVKTDSSKYLQFKLKYDKIQADIKKDNRITNPVEEIIGFDREITEAVANRFITQEEGRNLRDMMITPVYEKAKNDAKGGGFFGWGQSPWQAGYQTLDTHLDKDKSLRGKDKEQRKYQVLNKFVSEFNKLSNKTEIAARELAQRIIESDNIDRHPVLGTLPATPNSIMTRSGQVNSVLAGASKLTAEQGLQPPFTLMIDKNGVKARVYKDGRVEEIR